MKTNKWKFRWSKWAGVMYGPIPLGLIIGVLIIIFYNLYF